MNDAHDDTSPEPHLNRYRHRISCYFFATRPAFLSVTFLAVLLGWAGAVGLDHVSAPILPAALTLIFALCAHAGANVLNDYYDAKNGSDAQNQTRIYPFTGGSRFIQNGVLTEQQTLRFGSGLMLLVMAAGFYLAWQCGQVLLLIGLSGLILGWGYSAPPLFLVGRGLGEATITASWLLIILGSDFVIRQHLAFTPVALGMSFAIMVAAILYLNQFPDCQADAAAGKRTLIVRLGVRRARWGLPLLFFMAHGWLLLMVATGKLPILALCALLALIPAGRASRLLLATNPTTEMMVGAIQSTLAACLSHGALLILSLIFYRWFS